MPACNLSISYSSSYANSPVHATAIERGKWRRSGQVSKRARWWCDGFHECHAPQSLPSRSLLHATLTHFWRISYRTCCESPYIASTTRTTSSLSYQPRNSESIWVCYLICLPTSFTLTRFQTIALKSCDKPSPVLRMSPSSHTSGRGMKSRPIPTRYTNVVGLTISSTGHTKTPFTYQWPTWLGIEQL